MIDFLLNGHVAIAFGRKPNKMRTKMVHMHHIRMQYAPALPQRLLMHTYIYICVYIYC